jgi:hypothetical protein
MFPAPVDTAAGFNHSCWSSQLAQSNTPQLPRMTNAQLPVKAQMVCCQILQHRGVAVLNSATVADMHVVCRLLLILCRLICAHLFFRPAFMLIDHLPLGRCSGNTTLLAPPARGTRSHIRSARLPSVPRTLRPSRSAEQRNSTETAAFLRNWLGQGKPEETAQADAAATIEQTLLQ